MIKNIKNDVIIKMNLNVLNSHEIKSIKVNLKYMELYS